MMRTPFDPPKKAPAHPALTRLGRGLFAALFYLLLWQGLAMLVGKEVYLPSPLRVMEVLWGLVQTGGFWLACLGSLLRVLLGFVLAVVFGAGLSLLTSFLPAARPLIAPALHVVKATPVASFILIALIWLPGNFVPVFIAFLMVLPVVWGNLCEGFQSADVQLLEAARVYRFSPQKTLRLVYLPAVQPYFFAACKTGAGLAWKAGIAAEALGRTAHSIGRGIYDSKMYLEIPQLFAYTAALILLSLAFERLLAAILRRAARVRTKGAPHGK